MVVLTKERWCFFLPRHYVCSVCNGNVDAGELENGICYECRMEALRKQQSEIKVIKDEFEEERDRGTTSDEM